MSDEKVILIITIEVKIFLFALAFFANAVSAVNIYHSDELRYKNNSYGKMIEAIVFKFFIKFDRKATQIYLRTFIANLLLFSSVSITIVFFGKVCYN